jgi:hypothetical protein
MIVVDVVVVVVDDDHRSTTSVAFAARSAWHFVGLFHGTQTSPSAAETA